VAQAVKDRIEHNMIVFRMTGSFMRDGHKVPTLVCP